MNVRFVWVLLVMAGLIMPVCATSVYYPSSPGNIPDIIIGKLQEWFTGATGTQGPVGSGNMTMNQTANMTAGPAADLSNYYPLNGTSLLTGKMDAGTWNLSNITWTALMDAANVSYVIDTNTTMKTYVDTKPVINGTYLIGWSDAWNTSYDTISNVSQTNIVINNTLVSLINTNNNTLKDHGNLSGLTDDDHVRYFDKDLSKAATGNTIKRDVDNSLLNVVGGTVTAGKAPFISLYGADYVGVGGDIDFYVPNAAKNNWLLALRIFGNTDTPYLSLNTHKISDVVDPTAAQDAATMHYVEYPTVTASAQANALCYNTTTKRVTYNYGVTTCLASTESVKTNIVYLDKEEFTTRLMQLKPSYYLSTIDGEIHYGLIGEDIVKVFPELAAHDPEGTITGVRYEEFTSVLLKGFQEQQAIIEKQDERIRALEKKVGL